MDRTGGGAQARAVQHTGDHDPPRLRRAREAERDRYQQRGPARTFQQELFPPNLKCTKNSNQGMTSQELRSRLLVLNLSPVNLNMSGRFGINKY